MDMSVFDIKVRKVRDLLLNDRINKAVYITLQQNVSWLMCGARGFIGLASEVSCFQVLVTSNKVFVVSNNIEILRVEEEEIGRTAEICYLSFPWYEENRKSEILKELLDGGDYLDDITLRSEFSALRTVLYENEIELYRNIGSQCAKEVEDICKRVKQGVTEFEIAGEISYELWRKGFEPITLLVAADDRISRYRHPIPTENILQKHLMIAVCARKNGLVVSMTRFVYWGKIPDEIIARHKAVAEIDAALISCTIPGSNLREIFSQLSEWYEEKGYKDEWKAHHQGGVTGYLPREIKVLPGFDHKIVCNQAFAWNPSIINTKSEDTMLVGLNGSEIVTHTGDFPYLLASYKDFKVKRSAILRR